MQPVRVLLRHLGRTTSGQHLPGSKERARSRTLGFGDRQDTTLSLRERREGARGARNRDVVDSRIHQQHR